MNLLSFLLRRFSKRAPLIVGLDVGTRSIKIAVGERRANGRVTMVGCHCCLSAGLRKGEVMDQGVASRSIVQAIGEAEKVLEMSIEEVELAVTGSHLESANYHGSLNLPPDSPPITEGEVDEVLANARRGIGLAEGRVVLQTIRRHFSLDGKPGVIQPVGQVASLMEAEVHCIHGIKPRFESLTNCLQAAPDAPLVIASMVFSGLASALAVLEPQDKKLGAIVLDLGAGTTSYLVYAGNKVRQSGVIAVGGDHLVHDVQIGLKLRSSRKAEELIHAEGAVWPRKVSSDRQIVIRTSELTEERERTIPLCHLHTILYHRMDELLRIIHARIVAQGMDELVGGTVFLTGGSARLRGLSELAASIFRMEVKRAVPCGFDGVTDPFVEPEMATVVGLIKYRAMRDAESPTEPWSFGGFFRRLLHDWLGTGES